MLANASVNVDDNLSLKQINLDDQNKLYNLILQNKNELKPWFSWAKNITLSRVKNFIQYSIKQNQKNNQCDLGIFYNNILIGVISLINIKEEFGSLEIAYWLSKDYGKKGVITKCCKKIEEYCFAKLNSNKLFIIAFAENQASRAIPEKLGYNISNVDKTPTIINNNKSYYVYYVKTKKDFEKTFSNSTIYSFNQPTNYNVNVLFHRSLKLA